MIRYIIFDMDGVLVDSERAIRAASVKMFAGRGVDVPQEDFLPFTGMGANRFIGGVAEKYGLPFRPEMKDEAYDIYGEIAGEYVIVYEGIGDLLAKLRERGCQLAVASAADWVKVSINLRCMGLSSADFDAVVTGNDVTKHKPDPEAFLIACGKLGGHPGETLVVEDAVAGCQAAKAAGMSCVGVMSTFDYNTLKNAGADFVVEKTNDMLRGLRRWGLFNR